jgi:hypothetical protein
MTMDAPVFSNWAKSPRSGGGDHCVEWATTADSTLVGVRDSKNRSGAVLIFTAAEWSAFIGGAKDGAFDS